MRRTSNAFYLPPRVPLIHKHTPPCWQMPFIYAYFYAPSADDHVVNHIVTRWDPPYSHCDVQFEDGMASSLFQGENVYWRKRGFKKPGYIRITLAINNMENYRKAYDLCKDRHAQGYAFDAIGMYTLPLSSYVSFPREKYTFCSKHCTEVLQLAGVRAVQGLDPRSITPSALHRALDNNSSVLHTDRIDLRITLPTPKADV